MAHHGRQPPGCSSIVHHHHDMQGPRTRLCFISSAVLCFNRVLISRAESNTSDRCMPARLLQVAPQLDLSFPSGQLASFEEVVRELLVGRLESGKWNPAEFFLFVRHRKERTASQDRCISQSGIRVWKKSGTGAVSLTRLHLCNSTLIHLNNSGHSDATTSSRDQP